jgi:hypothetical protein
VLRNWTLGRKLYAVAGLMSAAGVALAVSGIQSTARLNRELAEVTDVTAEVMYLGGQIQYDVADLRAATRMMIVAAALQDRETVEEKARERDEHLQDLKSSVARLRELTHVPRVRELGTEVERAVLEWQTASARVHEQAALFNVQGAAEANRGDRHRRRLLSALAATFAACMLSQAPPKP